MFYQSKLMNGKLRFDMRLWEEARGGEVEIVFALVID